MAESDDDGLMLNIFQNDLSTNVVRSNEKRKLNKKRGQIKQKQSGIVKKKTFEVDSPANNTRNDEKKETSFKTKSGNASKIPSFEGGLDIISSLFTKNPEIPDVPEGKTACDVESQALFSEGALEDTQISKRLMKNLKDRLGFEKFTEVQKQAIPVILSHKDVLIRSPTGSGKTLAYALPLIQRLQQLVPQISRIDGPYAVVLLPTRELATQSFEVFESLCRTFVWIVPGLIVGGEKRKAEKSRIRKGINIVIATPGRLLDHLQTTECLNMKNILFMVFDEADRLLDMGFEQTISTILSFVENQCSKKVQRALLSATLCPGVKNFASVSLKDPIFIDMSKKECNVEAFESHEEYIVEEQKGNLDEEQMFVTPSTLKQYFVIAPAKLRLVSLISFLLKHGCRTDNGKVIVFFSSKSSTELHNMMFTSETVKETFVLEDCSFYKLHGDMNQKERNDVFHKFKRCNKGILLCTDVAARGLDLPRVNWIIQYSCPTQIQDYIHRVGRTARIGAEGKALLFLLPSEVKYVTTLEGQNVELQKMNLFEILRSLVPKAGKRTNQSMIQDAATALQIKLEELVLGSTELKTVAEKAFRSFIQSYATYPSKQKDIFHVKKLHLGHIAKSFALRTAPQQMKLCHSDNDIPSKKKDDHKFKKTKKRRTVDMSESGGGLVINGPMPGAKKRKNK